jgi:hypothetical protein
MWWFSWTGGKRSPMNRHVYAALLHVAKGRTETEVKARCLNNSV